ncbi:MAG: 5-formyltetrahydrofolate cyclo-ligase [Rhodospirillales bacterium]|nr:MAG: 5-formyltetrahydrofolate cyclo-ligase [Rhodospirillales bacterium]
MQPSTDLNEAKEALRRESAARRARAAAADDGSAAGDLAARFFVSVTVPAGAPVSGYWPIRSEIDVMPLLRALAARGHHIALPVVEAAGRELVFRRWCEGAATVAGPYGIREPVSTAPVLSPRVVLVPLLAFDRAGWRLGYGGGFYDRSLAALRRSGPVLAVGVAWASQEVPAVPRDDRDQRLDWVVTEREACPMSRGAA